MQSIRFSKYHALGNSYLVVTPDPPIATSLAASAIRLCDVRQGIGSDGLLVGPLPSSSADFGLRIFNSDGSEAEKSGNGLRIFCRYLWDQGLVLAAPFSVETKGGVVKAEILDEGKQVRVGMGKVSFSSTEIPVAGSPREVLSEEVELDGKTLRYCAATVGNPHCVVLADQPSEAETRHFGPMLERHPLFPNRTNVQFMKIIDRHKIQIEIWERGTGYTFASGSSSCAAAAVAYRLGLCDSDISVHMRGGQIQISLGQDFDVVMTGPVADICSGDIKGALLTS